MSFALQAAHDDTFSSMAKQMSKWVDQVLGPGLRPYVPDSGWVPAINVCEGADHYCVVADLAGMEAENIDVRTAGRMLTLSGCRDVAGQSAGGGKMQMRHMEIDHGTFCRTVELPPLAKMDEMEAIYRAGYLLIIIPKKA